MLGLGDFEVPELGAFVAVVNAAELNEVLSGLGVLLSVGVSVGVGVAVGVLVGVGVGVLVGVGVGVGVASRSGSHSWSFWVSVAARAAVLARLGWAADATAGNAVAAATRMPPVVRLAVTSRTCAKRMKGPPVLLVCCCGNDYSVWSGYIRRATSGSYGTPTIGH